jgi:hypothetical protein
MHPRLTEYTFPARRASTLGGKRGAGHGYVFRLTAATRALQAALRSGFDFETASPTPERVFIIADGSSSAPRTWPGAAYLSRWAAAMNAR